MTAPADLTKTVRYGIEATRGTGGTCTNIWDVSDVEWDIIPPKIRSGNLTGGVYASNVVTAGVLIPRVRLKFASLNFDRIQRLLACAVDGSITSTGAGANKSWGTVKPPAVSTGAALTEALKSLTLEFGYANPSAANPAHKVTGAICDRLKFTFAPNGFVSGEADFVSIGTVTDLTAYSGTLTGDTVAASPDFSGFLFYVDDTTIGTTADGTIIGGEVEWKGHVAPDDNAKRLGISRVTEWTGSLTRFWEAADMIANARTGAEKKVRMLVNGPVLGSGTYSFGVDLYGYADAVDRGEINGFRSEEVKLVPKRDVTLGSDISFSLVNSMAAL
jgi:hypothetical protein